MAMGKSVPDDLQFEILLRLPVKSIRRFESVSTSWFSVIHDRVFINHHLQEANSTLISLFTPPSNSTSELNNFIGFSDMDSPQNFRKLEYKGGNQVLSCNGLLCFSLCSNRYIVISNLISKPTDYHMVSIPSLGKLRKGVYSRPPFYGFGYDSVNDDYKVFVMDDCGNWRDCYAVTRIYSLKSNVWTQNKRWDALGQSKMFPIIVNDFRLGDTSPNGLVASGAFHWLAVESRWHTGPKFILAFSLTSEEFYEVTLPDIPQTVEFDAIGRTRLGVLKGCLCISARGIKEKSRQICVWVMKDYNIHASWTKIIHIEDNSGRPFPSSLTPTYSRSEYKVLFLSEFGQRFYWYDMRNSQLINCVSNSLHQSALDSKYEFLPATICLETLVSVNDYKVLWKGDFKRKRKRNIDPALRGTKRRWTRKDEEQAKQALDCFFNLRDNFNLFRSKC